MTKQMPNPPLKILVVRNDKLGDFTLALPSFALLKANLPTCQLSALVSSYTYDIANLSSAIDQIIIDPGSDGDRQQQLALLHRIQQQNFDAALTLYSTTRIGWLLWRSNIRHRFAPATKLAQLFYNHRLKQRRSLSEKPEFQYNMDLTEYLLEHFSIPVVRHPSPPYLKVGQGITTVLRQEFYEKHGLETQALAIFLHPGHGGSANNLSLKQYATLANLISCRRPLNFIISAGPGETNSALTVQERITRHTACLYESSEGLTRFVQHISFADLFISGSTGTLHIAGALNRPTCGFYPNRRSATSLRWQTLSDANHRLAFSPPHDAEAEDMSRIDLKEAASAISELLNRLYT